jgi:hypothetical protein
VYATLPHNMMVMLVYCYDLCRIEKLKKAFRKYLESSGVLDTLTKGMHFIACVCFTDYMAGYLCPFLVFQFLLRCMMRMTSLLLQSSKSPWLLSCLRIDHT